MIRNLVEIKELEIKKETIYITKKTNLWCTLPYKNHKNGCPNYNKNLLCPPNSPNFINFIDDYTHFYLFYAIFDFKQYKEIRKHNKPELSNAQISCVLYWQSSIKKLLKDYIRHIYTYCYNNLSEFYLLSCGSGFKDKILNLAQNQIFSMESVGIDVFRTLKNNNIEFELKPMDKIVLVCLLSSKSKKEYYNGLI